MVFNPANATITPSFLHTSQSWETFYAAFDRCLKNPQITNLLLDLRKIEFFRPETVLLLMNAARLWHAQRGKAIQADFTDEVQAYLQRMDVFDACSNCIDPVRAVDERFARKYESANLMEMTPLSSDVRENAYNVVKANERAKRILQNAEVPEQRAAEVCGILSEIAQNVVHSADTGYAIIQKYFILSAQTHRVHIAVSDLGKGIQASLLERYKVQQLKCRTEADYILRALDRKFSSRPLNEGGLGLPHVRLRVDANQGVLIIRSGRSLVHIEGGKVIVQQNDLTSIPGVRVFLTVYGAPAEWF